jgi:hypothetical protein
MKINYLCLDKIIIMSETQAKKQKKIRYSINVRDDEKEYLQKLKKIRFFYKEVKREPVGHTFLIKNWIDSSFNELPEFYKGHKPSDSDLD